MPRMGLRRRPKAESTAPYITGWDIRPEVGKDARAAGADLFCHHDWLQPIPDELRPRRVDGGLAPAPDLIVGNPPFDGAELHLARSLERVHPDGVVAFLLSCNLFWPSRKKEALWDLPGLWLVQPWYPRCDFIGAGSVDAVGVATFVWAPRYQGAPLFRKPRRWRGGKHGQGELPFGDGLGRNVSTSEGSM